MANSQQQQSSPGEFALGDIEFDDSVFAQSVYGESTPSDETTWTERTFWNSWLDILYVVLTVTLGVAAMTLAYWQRAARQPQDHISNEQQPDAPVASAPQTVEMPLGTHQFVLSSRRQAESVGDGYRVRMVQFSASAVVTGNDRQLLNLTDRAAVYKHRIGEVLEATTRAATADELADPELQSVRKRLREQVNRLIGDGLIEEIVFDNFRSFEMPTEQ